MSPETCEVAALLDALAAYKDDHAPGAAPPAWKEGNTPALQAPVLQATANGALLQPSRASSLDSWLRRSPRETGQPVLLPVKRADEHRPARASKTLRPATPARSWPVPSSAWRVADALL
jgi:hypothetical protein